MKTDMPHAIRIGVGITLYLPPIANSPSGKPKAIRIYMMIAIEKVKVPNIAIIF